VIYTRRDFLKVTSASVAAIGVVHEVVIPVPMTTPHPICVFSLCLQFLDCDDLGGAEEGILHPSMPLKEIYKHLVRDLRYFKNTLLRNYGKSTQRNE
jgi:hypothetical protein